MFNWLHNMFNKKKEIIMIAALQNDRGIGYHEELIHSIKDDMKHFVAETTGNTVIMGRKNWETIPEKYRPFKNRQNIVITRNPEYVADGALVVSSLEEAIKQSIHPKIYIIGGGEIYRLGLEYADTLDLTHIDSNKPADTFFPDFTDSFKKVSSSEKIFDEKTGLSYQFQIWKKK